MLYLGYLSIGVLLLPKIVMTNRLAKHTKSFKLKQGPINSFLQFFSQELELCTNNGSFVKKGKYFRHKLVVSLTNENQILPLGKTK